MFAEVVGQVGEQLAVLEGPAGQEVHHCFLVVVYLYFLLEGDHLQLLDRPDFDDLHLQHLGGYPEKLADSWDEALVHGDDGVAVVECVVQGGEVADEGGCFLQCFELIFVVEIIGQFGDDVVLPYLPVTFDIQVSIAHVVDLPEGILQKFLNDIPIVLIMNTKGDLIGESLKKMLNILRF